MKVLSIQMALFTRDLISRQDLVMSGINEKTGKIFNAMPNIMNLPLDAPPEIPLVQVVSTDGMYNLNVSRNRVDLTISPKYEREDAPADLFKEYKILLEKYYKSVFSAMDLIRVGVVITLFHEASNNVEAVFDRGIKESFSTDCVEASYRINKQNLYKGFVYNNIKSVQAGEVHVNNAVHKGVLIQLDTNNVPDSNKVISNEDISHLLAKVSEKIKVGQLKELI